MGISLAVQKRPCIHLLMDYHGVMGCVRNGFTLFGDQLNILRASKENQRASRNMIVFMEDFFRVWELTSGSVFRRATNCYPAHGLHAIGVYRLGHWLKNKQPLILKILLGPMYLVLQYRIRTR